jgi:hypothetical protein
MAAWKLPVTKERMSPVQMEATKFAFTTFEAQKEILTLISCARLVR